MMHQVFEYGLWIVIAGLIAAWILGTIGVVQSETNDSAERERGIRRVAVFFASLLIFCAEAWFQIPLWLGIIGALCAYFIGSHVVEKPRARSGSSRA